MIICMQLKNLGTNLTVESTSTLPFVVFVVVCKQSSSCDVLCELCKKLSLGLNGCWFSFVVVFCFTEKVLSLLAPCTVGGDVLCLVVMMITTACRWKMLGCDFFNMAVNTLLCDYLMLSVCFLASIVHATSKSCKQVLRVHQNKKSEGRT